MSSASYNPKDYWIEQGKVYKNNFRYNNKFELQERLLIEYLASNIFTPTNSGDEPAEFSVLEVGCGFGRITKLLLTNFGKVDGRAHRAFSSRGAIPAGFSEQGETSVEISVKQALPCLLCSMDRRHPKANSALQEPDLRSQGFHPPRATLFL